ncbi:1841_t:CDS:2 [Racocetra persica]|uniref:1841_t:CDS:1 n=1 Tax=Racocetra persica TaxID=160502 RepID=A0ACA9LT13_9GLOM|nr:1841_t:CDS:2 [Racocetra persica]
MTTFLTVLRIAQPTNAEASIFYVVNSETGTSYTVNAEVSILYTVMIDQVANIESSTSYAFTAEAITSDATNTLCKNAVYDEATTEKVNSIGEMQHDFSLLKLGYTFPLWDDVKAFFKTYDIDLLDVSLEENMYLRRISTLMLTATDNKTSIGDEALNDIEFYTKNGNLSITIQCQLLRAKYPDATFLDMDLTNAIQYYKVKSKDLKNDASQLLLYLTEKRSEESGWSVEFDEILPAVDHIFLEYLTLQILSIERIEMAQCLYFDTTLVDLTVIRLDNENENISDDLQKIKKKEIDQENVIFANSDASEAQQGQKTPLISKPFTVSCSIAISNRSAAARHSKFGEIWGLAQQAVQLAVECDDNDMKLWLKCFINQKKYLLIQNEEPKNSDNSKNSEKENNSAIKNPAITKHRGRPATKRFKAATEKPRRQPYTYRNCGKTRHNSAKCQKKVG